MVRKVYLLFSSPDCLIVCFIFIVNVTAFLMLFFASLVDCFEKWKSLPKNEQHVIVRQPTFEMIFS